ncbi:MAG: hypothetical protein ACRC0L_07785, partial [Angustibacter sp.]
MTEEQAVGQESTQESAQNPEGQESTEQGNEGQQHGSREQGNGGMTPEQMQAEITRLRNESGRYRTERNNQRDNAGQLQQQFDQMRQGMARALGLENDEPDAGELQGQLQTTQAQYRRERLQNVVLVDSLSQNADPSLMWAHLFASGALDDLDINGGDFAETVNRRVKDAMERN